MIKRTPGELSWDDIKQFIAGESIDLLASDNVRRANDFLNKSAGSGVIYGVNTGFGKLANVIIAEADIATLQRNIVLSHASGVGEPLPEIVVRLMMFLKLNSLARGHSGVRPELIQFIEKMLQAKLYPRVPAKGSVGACGDLAPLAHFALTLIGEGELWHEGDWRPSVEVLAQHGLEPMCLVAKEGLALLNGVQASNAVALYAYQQLEHLFDWALVAGAMATDALKASVAPFHKAIQRVKGSLCQATVAKKLQSLLAGSGIQDSHADCDRVQDPYSFRCQPQVMGACFEQMLFAKSILMRESNAVSDNPLIFVDEKCILSGGNFHGQALAMACDNLALAIAEIGSLSERRLAILMDDHMSGLPPFLVPDSGLNSGFMMAQVTTAALVSENKALATPRSVDSIPTSANQEDHVSMANNAALRLLTMCDHLRSVLAIELLAAAQSIDFHRPLKLSDCLEAIHADIREQVPFYDKDRYFAGDIEAMTQFMRMNTVNHTA